MPVKFSRTYWKMKVGAAVLDRVRTRARELDPSGENLDEDADCVRVIGSEEQIQEIEKVAGLPDPDYWAKSAKKPEGAIAIAETKPMTRPTDAAAADAPKPEAKAADPAKPAS